MFIVFPLAPPNLGCMLAFAKKYILGYKYRKNISKYLAVLGCLPHYFPPFFKLKMVQIFHTTHPIQPSERGLEICTFKIRGTP